MNCFICNITCNVTQSATKYITRCQSKHSKTKYTTIVEHIIGETYEVNITSSDFLCHSCVVLLEEFDRLRVETKVIQVLMQRQVYRTHKIPDEAVSKVFDIDSKLKDSFERNSTGGYSCRKCNFTTIYNDSIAVHYKYHEIDSHTNENLMPEFVNYNSTVQMKVEEDDGEIYLEDYNIGEESMQFTKTSDIDAPFDSDDNKNRKKRKREKKVLINPSLICHICVRNFSNKDQYQLHIKSHQTYIYNCSDCSFETNVKEEVFSHRQFHHSNKVRRDETTVVNPIDKFDCQKCGRRIKDMEHKCDEVFSDERRLIFTEIDNFPADVFKFNFRISRKTVSYLENRLFEQFKHLDHNRFGGRPTIPLQHRLLLVLWTLGNTESFRAIAGRFKMSSSSAHKCFFETTALIAAEYDTYIKWPINYSDAANQFEMLNPNKTLPGIIGVLDGFDITLKPTKEKQVFANQNGSHSIKIQTVCDSKYKFTDITIGIPGVSSDIDIWHESAIYEKLSKDEKLSDKYHLIGDSKYPLKLFLMKPHCTINLTDKQIEFNKIVREYGVVVKKTFNLLQARFNRIQKLKTNKTEELKNIIMSTCVIHNLAIDQEDDMDFDLPTFTENIIEQDCINPYEKFDGAAEVKRQRLTDSIM